MDEEEEEEEREYKEMNQVIIVNDTKCRKSGSQTFVGGILGF